MRLGRAAAIALGVALGAAPARADDAKVADELFRKGRALYDAGQLEEACAALAKSQAADPSVGTLGLLAACEEKRGFLASAHDHFAEAARMARAAGDKREKYAGERAAQLRPKVPRLVIRVDAADPPARVTRGGKDVPANRLGEELLVDPGRVEIVAFGARGGEHTRTVTLAVGERMEVVIPRIAPPPAAAPPAPRGTPVARTFAWITGGLGLGGLGLGAGLGAMAMAQKGDIAACDPAAKSCAANAAALRAANGSTAAFVAGAGLLVASTVLFVVSRPGEAKPAVSVGVSPSGAVVVRGSF